MEENETELLVLTRCNILYSPMVGGPFGTRDEASLFLFVYTGMWREVEVSFFFGCHDAYRMSTGGMNFAGNTSSILFQRLSRYR